MAVADLAVGVAYLRGEPGPGAQLAGGREPTDVPDLGDQRHRRQLADAGEDRQRLDPWVGLGQRMNLPLQAGDRGGQGVQQPAAVLDDPAWDRRQLKLGQPGPLRTGPQAPVLTDATIGQHRVDRFFSPVLSRTRLARWRSNARRSLVAWGAIQASGNKSARSNCARVAASTLSFLSLVEAMALQRLGWTRCGSS
jgi:hypothetical protein